MNPDMPYSLQAVTKVDHSTLQLKQKSEPTLRKKLTKDGDVTAGGIPCHRAKPDRDKATDKATLRTCHTVHTGGKQQADSKTSHAPTTQGRAAT